MSFMIPGQRLSLQCALTDDAVYCRERPGAFLFSFLGGMRLFALATLVSQSLQMNVTALVASRKAHVLCAVILDLPIFNGAVKIQRKYLLTAPTRSSVGDECPQMVIESWQGALPYIWRRRGARRHSHLAPETLKALVIRRCGWRSSLLMSGRRGRCPANFLRLPSRGRLSEIPPSERRMN